MSSVEYNFRSLHRKLQNHNFRTVTKWKLSPNRSISVSVPNLYKGGGGGGGGGQSTNFDCTMVPSDRSPPVPALYPPFLTKLLVGWQHKRQPITRDVRNSCPQGALFTNESVLGVCSHDGVIKWKHFPRYWPFVREIPRSPVNSPHKGQWRGAFMFSFMFFLTWPLAGWQHSCQPIRSHVRNHCPLATISNESFLGACSIYGVRPHNNVISSPAVGTVPSIRASSVERGHRLATNPCAHRAQEHGQSNYIHQNSQWRCIC